MKRLIPLITLVAILAGLPVVVVSDTDTPFTDTNIFDNEMTTNQAEASNSWASGTITITMYTVADE